MSSSNHKLGALIQEKHFKADKPRLGETVLKLYHHNTTWRGAVDMAIIGSIMLLVSNGLPLNWLPSTSSPAQKPDAQTSATSPTSTSLPVSPPTTTSSTVATNFSPADPQKQTVPVSSAIPDDKLPGHVKNRQWFTSLDKESEVTLIDAYRDLAALNRTAAFQKLTPKAEAGNADFQYAMAVAYVGNTADPSYKQKAFYWQHEAAVSGHPQAQYQLAQYYRLGFGGVPNINEAIRWYEQALASGEADAGNELGRLYESGNGVTIDPVKALNYYRQGAEGGSKFAQSNYGAAYYNGTLGLPRDPEKAVHWIKLAAEQNYAPAQLNLAQMYRRGRMASTNETADFLLWAGKAADQGEVRAMLVLADYYLGKDGNQPDNQLAAHWYRRAALKKNATAEFMLARMYEQGTGVAQDKIQAYVYYSLAHRAGFGQAYSARETLKANMSAAELERADFLAKGLTSANDAKPSSLVPTVP